MATIWQWIRHLKLRNKLALIYTVVFTTLLGISYIFIYVYSEENREDIFHERLTERIVTGFKMILQFNRIDRDLLKVFDVNAIGNLKDKKVFLFDSSGGLIYKNVDSSNPRQYEYIVKRLNKGEKMFNVFEDEYELLGIRFIDSNKTYYGVVKAYDRFGKTKVHFLAMSLITIFFIVTIIIIILSILLSKVIAKPITELAEDVEKISPDDLSVRIVHRFADDEIGFLANKFNVLLEKVENAFKFQVHYISHLSHELKTPLAIMMANAERSLAENNTELLRMSMQFQKDSIMELSNVITALLDISKMETKLAIVNFESLRIDEIVFECMDEIIFLNEHVSFDFNITNTQDESDLMVIGNRRMIKMALMNLIKNAVNFSENKKPSIEISATRNSVEIKISNDGAIIKENERTKLFMHSFRGENSTLVKGFGLGLVLSQRIVSMHKGSLTYSIEELGLNQFVLSLPHRSS